MSRDDCFPSPPADAPKFFDWVFLGRGSYNWAYFNSIINQVFKFPRDTQGEFFFDDPLRLVKIWNKLNPHIPPARLHSLQDNNGNWHHGWMASFVDGKNPRDDQMAILINHIYITTRRIFMDGCNPRNSIEISIMAILTCIDPGMVIRLDGEYDNSKNYRPTSPTSMQILNFGDEYEEYWHQYIAGINKNSQKFEPYPKSTHMIRAILYLECSILVRLAYADENNWSVVQEYARFLPQYPGLTAFLSHLFDQQKTLPDLELVHLFFHLQKKDADHIKKADDALQYLVQVGLLEDFFDRFHAHLFLQERWQYFLNDVGLLNALVTLKEKKISLKLDSTHWEFLILQHSAAKHVIFPEKKNSLKEKKKNHSSIFHFFHWSRNTAVEPIQNQTHPSPSLTSS